MELLERFWQGEKRALARIISLVENGGEGKEEVLTKLYPHTGKAQIIGITGAPGAGKSSLTDCLIELSRKENKTVAVVAVDPSSPFTGGALLGDRIRMQNHAVDDGVYIRSMGSRGSLGGISAATKDVVKVLDAFGFDYIIIETVGVGQGELDVMHVADTVLVVLTPTAGDSIQTIKAGIMEIADIFVVNKADLPGAGKMVMDINTMLDLKGEQLIWRPPVIKTSTNTGEGLSELLGFIKKHFEFLINSQLLEKKRQDRREREIIEISLNIVSQKLQLLLDKPEIQSLIAEVNRKLKPPQTAAVELLNRLGVK
ncbi:methylmalonyl Co-A mutase-associated GTPase MeaB [Carboxydothermus pertinax]|uniref:GTPase n=1 Tax=Carboxydothermus pertinax TaxID=870242 RepID=A0A1L8CU31_9THEO|nr:methylmalonyl Co-A mutase-associated GTPase MeaB [Carboxydothermus pertinax]GAV22412.1 GTPase [Carboxydothermus pertinax]